MEIKTTIKLTREEKIALIKTYEILSDLDKYSWDNEPLDRIGDVLCDLSIIMDSLGEKYGVNFFNLNE